MTTDAPPPEKNTKPCAACGEDIPRRATICPSCHSPQGGGAWGYVPVLLTVLSLITALISVISSGLVPVVKYFDERNSTTVFRVTGADQNQVHVVVWNTGLKPSVLTRYRLMFDDLPAEKGELTLELNGDDQDNARNVILPGAKPVAINVSLPTIASLATQPRQYGGKDLAPLRSKPPSSINATLEIDVDESNAKATRKDQFTAERIAAFLPRALQ